MWEGLCVRDGVRRRVAEWEMLVAEWLAVAVLLCVAVLVSITVSVGLRDTEHVADVL